MAFNVFQLRYSWDCEIVTRTLTINYSLTEYVSAIDLDPTTWTRTKLKWQHINKQHATSNKIKYPKITPPFQKKKGSSVWVRSPETFRPKGSTQLIQVSKRAKCAGNKIFQNLSWKDSRTGGWVNHLEPTRIIWEMVGWTHITLSRHVQLRRGYFFWSEVIHLEPLYSWNKVLSQQKTSSIK